MPAASRRHLNWNNCLNVRDLGGLKMRSGGETRLGSLIRADSLDRLTADGMRELCSHGVTTIIDLRDEREVATDRLPPPAGVARKHLPLEDQQDEEFWSKWRPYFCTPLYYGAFLSRSPDRVARVFAEIAGAPSGGIVFHCGSGRDRTGLVSVLLLALAEVLHEEIAADYELSAPNLKSIVSQREEQVISQALAERQTTLNELVREIVSGLDAEDYLLKAGLTAAQVGRVRGRLVGEI